jgi:hypothetical protein
VSGCHFINNGKGGFFGGAMDDCSVVNNVSRGNSDRGINPEAARNVAVVGNSCIGNDNAGLSTDLGSRRISFVGNVVKDALSMGIRIPTSDASHITIAGNVIENAIGGIRWSASGPGTISNNVISNATNRGIYNVGSGNNVSCVGNVIDTTGKAGIRVWTDAMYWTVSGNTIVNAGGDGIEINDGSTYNLVNDNTIVGSSGSAVSVNGSADYNSIQDNIFDGNSGGGISGGGSNGIQSGNI